MKEYYKSTRLARLLTKFVMQDISEGEKKELVSLARKAGVNIQKIIQDVAEKEMTLGNDDAEIETGKKVWLSIENELKRPKRHVGRLLLRYAAIIIVCLGLSGGFYLYMNQVDDTGREIVLLENETVLEFPSGHSVVLTDKTNVLDIIRQNTVPLEKKSTSAPELYKVRVLCGATRTIILEDSTTVVLYPGSELQFPEFFSLDERSVMLLGEGYFNVKRDSTRPFTVNTEQVSIEVLGTSFNVRAYKEEQTIETVLVSGKVMLNGTTVLQPNQMAIFDFGNRQIKIEEVNADVYRERSRGMFVFDNRTLDEIMHEFSQWFGFEYSFEDSALKNKKFRLRLPHMDRFDQLMSLMEKTGEIRFLVSGNHIKIKNGKE